MVSRQEPTIDELFEAVVDLSDQERARYLAEAGVSERQREEVLELIRADAASPSDSKLYSVGHRLNVARMLPDGLTADCLIGSDLGPYRIKDVIGIGGFGTVYHAVRSHPFEQRVAIKVVRADRSLNEYHRQRFEVERSVLARLEHPNIAKLLDGGCSNDGRSYFVMEYIAGQPLAEYCDARTLTIEHRLKLFLNICNAAAYAHQLGIVHRDLKSENILVLEGGIPKLIDFGIAKIVSDWDLVGKDLTRTGDTLLTPTCASPEQLCGEPITTAADVYALGVILYELLTGCYPIEFESQQSVAHSVLNRQPDLPSRVLKRRFPAGGERRLEQILTSRATSLSALQRHLASDLDRIVMMSLRKEPARRYRSAVELHADIQNYLEARPIRARSDSIAYRTSKAARRSLTTVAVIAVLAMACVLFAMQRRLENERQLSHFVERAKGSSFEENFDLFVELQDQLRNHPDDPRLHDIMEQVAVPTSIQTTNKNVKCWVRPAQDPLRDWWYVGTSPLAQVTLPKAFLQWRIQDSQGTEFIVLRKNFHDMLRSQHDPCKVELTFPYEHDAPPGMVKLTLDSRKSIILHNGARARIDGEIFFDKFEVTNAQFQKFVDAGGYEDPQLRKHWPPFFRDGKPVDFSAAIKEFRDETAEFGPGNWQHGRFPEGEADFPVREISWFEAMAYANFSEKRLPSIFHWVQAASQLWSHGIVVMSNMQDLGLASDHAAGASNETGQVLAVGTKAGVGEYGTFDMAGNVREWCFNDTSDGRKYALGGSFGDVTYMYTYPDAASAWERSPEIGFRCMSFGGNEPANIDDTLRPVELAMRDFSKIEPCSKDEFESYKHNFLIKKGEPQFEIEDDVEEDGRVTGLVDASRARRIVYSSVYGEPPQTITGILYLPDPEDYDPPYQTIIEFPGAYALWWTAFEPSCLFLLESGRAVFRPDYWGTGARRREEFTTPQPAATPEYRDAIEKIAMDFSRSIDVLEQIDLVRQGEIGFHGLSWGAALGPILLAIDDRCRAAVLTSGGLAQTETYRITDQATYCPHVTCPILMLNGRNDVISPPPAQQAMLDLFPGEKHKLQPFNAGHFVNPRDHKKYTTDWFDQHLGLVRPK